ncbi:MAG TPA: thioredoxin family protein [Saprospiraceae bacterium]|nr:thioredoxin family protein [Saprospiraceae bacterium]
MQRFFYIILSLFFVNGLNSQTINFKSSLEPALTEAFSSDKLIFVDVMADWCGPCKLMEKEMNADTSFINYYNEHFVNLKINEKGNKTFLKQYDIKSFPTLLFLNKSGEVVERLSGYKKAKYLKDKAIALQSLKSVYNKEFVVKKGEKFNEEQFLNEISQAISPMSLTARNGYLNIIAKKGQPFAKPILTKYNTSIEFTIFQEAYLKINDKTDQTLAENLMVSFLTSDKNFQNDDKIKAGCANLTQLTGIKQEKVYTYIMAYRELNVRKQIGMSNPESLYLTAKDLLTQYPETGDMALLYQAFKEVVKANNYDALIPNVAQALSAKKGLNDDYRYHDIMSIINNNQQKKAEADKSLAQAKSLAKKSGLVFVPLLDELSNETIKK